MKVDKVPIMSAGITSLQILNSLSTDFYNLLKEYDNGKRRLAKDEVPHCIIGELIGRMS